MLHPKAVTVFAGRRDGYQVPLSLQEASSLEAFVTDVYFDPAQLDWANVAAQPRRKLRSCKGLPAEKVQVDLMSAAYSAAAVALPRSRKLLPARDKRLSVAAARLAIETEAVYFPYSYYAGEGLLRYRGQTRRNLVYQVHPSGAFLRKIYEHDMQICPEGRDSLLSEDEFRQRGEYQDGVEAAPSLADGVICASSFTRRSLIETGVTAPIAVVPYGVDTAKLRARTTMPKNERLVLSFVGSVNQRKGFLHLVAAIKMSGVDVELRVVTRSRPGAVFIEAANGIRCTLHLGKSDAETWDIVRSSDAFVLPSVAEGFGLVLLEAMSCGVPIVATTATGAPDIITHGREGYIAQASDRTALAAIIAKMAGDRTACYYMGIAARQRAEQLHWGAFRSATAAAYEMLLKNR